MEINKDKSAGLPFSPHGIKVKISAIPKPKAAFTHKWKVNSCLFSGPFILVSEGSLIYACISYSFSFLLLLRTQRPPWKQSRLHFVYLCRYPVVFGSFRHFGSRDMWRLEDCQTTVILWHALVQGSPALLGTGPHGRRWAVGEQAKLHLRLPIACVTAWTTTPPIPWKNCLPRNWSLVPKRLGTAALVRFI